MDDALRAAIAKQHVVLLILPAVGDFEGTDGEKSLRIAMELGKHIIVWIPDDKPREPLPSLLDDYRDYVVVRGDEEAAYAAVEQFLELAPGMTIETTDWGYDRVRKEEGG